MKYIFIFLLGVTCFSSCIIQHRLYTSTQPNNPSLQQKNDYTASLTVSTPSGFDGNAGFAITNRLAVIGGLYTYKNKDQQEAITIFPNNKDSALLTYKHKGFHIGAGTFIPLAKNDSRGFLSFFGGYMKGNFDMQETLYSNVANPSNPAYYSYKSDINRWFLQGGINMYFKQFHQSFITRFNFVDYDKVKTNYTTDQQHDFNLPPTGYPRSSSFADFSFDTKIFFTKEERIGLQLFGSVTSRLKKQDFDFYIYPFRAGIGIIFKSPLKNKEPKK